MICVTERKPNHSNTCSFVMVIHYLSFRDIAIYISHQIFYCGNCESRLLQVTTCNVLHFCRKRKTTIRLICSCNLFIKNREFGFVFKFTRLWGVLSAALNKSCFGGSRLVKPVILFRTLRIIYNFPCGKLTILRRFM